MWLYNDKEFTSDMIGNFIGFVYVITDLKNGMKYIGKKGFYSKVTRPPLKGYKRKRHSFTESNWKDYYGSSENIKELIEECGFNRFKREIIRLCKSKGELSYYETKIIFETDALLKPEEYYNKFVGCKIHAKHIKL